MGLLGKLKSALASERGYAFVIVLGFIGLAVPIAVGSLQLTSQLALNAKLMQNRLIATYSSGGALEAAILEIKTNPFDPNDLELDINGGTTFVIIEGSATSSTDHSDFSFADAVFALDISGSDDAEQIQLKDAGSRIVDAFDLFANSERFQLGVTRFRGSSASIQDMTDVDVQIGSPSSDHWGGVAIHDAINGMNGSGLVNGVDIVAALQGGATQFSTGLGDRLNIPNVMVVILDDDDTKGNTDLDIANASAATGAEVFVVGVGAISATTMDAIASEPDNEHQWYSSDYAGLLALVETIADGVKGAGAVGTFYDIEITPPSGGVLLCRALLTLSGDVVVLSCQ